MRGTALVVALLISSLLSGRARAQDWKQWVPKLPSSPRGEQKAVAKKLMPVGMQLRGGDGRGEPRVIRVRVWAAADYRRQTREWQSRVRRLVERVDGAAQGWVRFEVVEQKPWPRESSEGALPDLVAELARLDAGDDVDLVVGMVAALPVFPGAVDNIGMARLFSKHMVMRSLHDLAEYDAVRQLFDTFTDSEKDAIVAARKLHKEQVVFLHEWAHTLGVVHVKREADIMNPAYDASQSGFDATETRIVETGLRHRAEDGPRWLEGSARDVRAIAETAPDDDWDPRDRQQLLAIVTSSNTSSVAANQEAAPSQPAPPPVAGPPLGEADRATVQAARTLAAAGKQNEAWARLAPLEAKQPRSAEVKLAACELAAQHPRGAAREALTAVACRAAAELAPRDPRPHLVLALLYLEDGDGARAAAPLKLAGELLEGSHDEAALAQYALAQKKAHASSASTPTPTPTPKRRAR
jgi:hypothetical protein